MAGGEPQEAGEQGLPGEAGSQGPGKGPETRATADGDLGHQAAVGLRHTSHEVPCLSPEGLAASHARYFELFDLAPVAYLILDAQGLILEANLAAANLLGVERGWLVGQPMIRFVTRGERQAYCLHHDGLPEATRPAEACELCLQRPDGASCWVQMQSAVAQAGDGAQTCRVTLTDITGRKQTELVLAEREQRLQTILRTALDGFWLLDLQGRFVEVNDAYCAMSGYGREELLRMRVPDLETVETEQDVAVHLARIASRGDDRFETRHRCKDGRVIDVDFSVNYLDIDGGRMVCFCRDITERKHAQAALRGSEAKLRVLFAAMTDVVIVLDRDGRCIEIAPSNPHYLYRPLEEQLGRTMHEVLPAAEADLILAQVRRALETRGTTAVDYRLEIGGAAMWFAARISPMSSDTVFFVGRNITERKQAEEALHQNEALYRALFEHAPVGIFRSWEDQALIVNPALARLFGYDSPEQFVALAREDGVASTIYRDPDERRRLVEAALRPGEWQQFENHYRRRDGSEMFCNLRLAAQVESDGKAYLTGFVEDITERRRAEAALSRSEAKYAGVFRNSPDAINVNRFSDGLYLEINDGFTAMTGYTAADVIGKTSVEVDIWADRADRDRLVAGLRERGEVANLEAPFRMKDGSIKIGLMSASIIIIDGETCVVSVTRDITERKQAEEALARAQKTESLSVMAGGVAHDFNNLLAAMLGQTSLALAKLPPGSAAREPIEKAVSAAHRAADLTRQLLAYSGRGRFSVKPLRLNALIEENLRLLEVAIPKHVCLCADLAGALPSIRADAGQMQQVLMNLIINAAEAIGSRPGVVTLHTSVSEVTHTDRQAWHYTGELLPPGRYVVLQVSDDGCGMDAETLMRIFDPFFSTKFAGRGLGLAAVLGIVRGHHGGLRVESTPGVGTTFRLAFPVAAHDQDGPAGALAAPPAAVPAVRAAGLILLIDDEEAVREAVTDILEMAGVRVLAAADGKSGLALYRENQAAIRLVLLDLSMPGMSAEETFRQLRTLDPGLLIILSSGYDESEVSARFAGQAPTGFVQKPYSMDDLTLAIRQHLRED